MPTYRAHYIGCTGGPAHFTSLFLYLDGHWMKQGTPTNRHSPGIPHQLVKTIGALPFWASTPQTIWTPSETIAFDTSCDNGAEMIRRLRHAAEVVGHAGEKSMFEQYATFLEEDLILSGIRENLCSIPLVSKISMRPDPRQAMHMHHHGHMQFSGSCIWSPDRRFILSSSGDSGLIIWDARTQKKAHVLIEPTHFSSHRAIAADWSNDGSFIVSDSFDKMVIIWDARTYKKLATLEGHTANITSCAISPNSQFILSGSYDNSLIIWDVRSHQQKAVLVGHTSYITDCEWSPDNKRIVSISNKDEKGSLKIWDVATKQCIANLDGHSTNIATCRYSPDGQYLISSSWDKTLKLWNATTFQPITTLIGNSERRECAFVWSPNSRYVAAAANWTGGYIKIVDVETRECVADFQAHSAGIQAYAWSADGNALLSAAQDYEVKIWNTKPLFDGSARRAARV